MTRADFWCRVLGWVQIVGAAVVGAAIYTLWAIMFSWIEIDDGGFFKMLMWFIVFIMAFPPFLAGLLTVIFADKVEQARNGFRENRIGFFACSWRSVVCGRRESSASSE